MSRPGARPLAIALATGVLALTLAGVPVHAAQSTDRAGPPRYPLSIEAPAPIARLIREHTLLGRWQGREDFDRSQMPLFLARAPQEIHELLATQGYFAPKVQIQAQGEGASILIDPGEPARVRRVELLIEDADAGFVQHWQRELGRRWPMPAGQPFVSSQWEAAKRKLIEALHDDGFLRARVSHSLADVDVATSSVDLELTLVPGPPFRFGGFEVRGLKRYPLEGVTGLSPFRAGDPYDARKLALMQSRLAGAGWFSTAHVRPDLAAIEDDPERREAPIRVDVVEHPAQRWTISGGVDADRGLSTQVQWDHYNLLGRGLRTMNGFDLDQERQLAFSTWETPQDASGWRWQVGLRYEQRDVRNDLVQSGLGFLGRLQREGLVERGWSVQWQDELQSIGLGPAIERRDRNSALVVGWNWTRRNLDSPVFPTRGQVINLQASVAHDALASERSFLRGYGMAIHLWPLHAADGREWARMILRAELGHVQATAREGIPSSNLFRTGGGKSVRGYGSQSLGVTLGEATVGGRVLAVASVEMQFPVSTDWAWAAFMDAGDAADRWSDWQAQRAIGLGIRWRTPVGPLQLDVARGLDPGQWRVHTSLGVVF